MIIGSGPNRIGQGIEFDYCCVHAVQTFRALGYEAVMINCNPETVSTDYDTSDRLYFEPLSPEEVLAVLDREQPAGVVTQFGGQTPLRLARHVEAAGYPIMGTPLSAIDLAEDRELFGALADDLGIRCPPWATVQGAEEAVAAAAEIGYPVLVRPSYVLGGRAMRVCYDDEQLRQAMTAVSGSVLVDRFVENAVEIDVDALCDGEDVFVAAVMQHVEEAGVHSGDSSCVLPAQSLTLANALEIEHIVKRLAPALGVVGLVNIQLAIADSTVYVLEANPRASRTVPFASKAIGINLVEAACKLAAGKKLSELALPTPRPQQVSVKAAVLPFTRFPGADPVLGPEMRSTGEVMASASDLPTALAKAERAAGRPLPSSGTAFISVNDADKPNVVPIAAALVGLGFEIVATGGTARTLRAAGLEVGEVAKVADAESDEQTVVDLVHAGRCDLIVNTPQGSGARADGYRIREAALTARVPCITTISGAASAVHAIANARAESALSLQERIGPGQVTGPTLAQRQAELACHGRRADRPLHAPAPRRRTAAARDPGAVLHAPSAGPCPAAPDVALPLRGGRALLPDRPDRARHASAVLSDPRRRARRAGATRQRLRPRRRAPAARRRRDRDRAAPVRRAGARRRPCPARLSNAAPGRRRPRSCRRRRSWWSPPSSPSSSPTSRPMSSRAGPSPCWKPSGGSRRPHSSPGRPRWPAATARVTAASSRSRAGYSGSAPPARCCGRREAHGHPDSQRQRLPRRAHGARCRGALDAFVTKTITPEPREGNPPVRIAETESGMLNSIGLQGPGIDGLLEDSLPALQRQGLRVWVSVGGFSAADFAGICERLDERADVEVLELNLSCPNVEEAPESSAEIVAACRGSTSKPLYAKLSPATWDIGETARAVVAAGADGLSLVNTMRGLVLDPATLLPVLGRGAGGYSGPALRPIALACVAGVRAGRRSADRGDGRSVLRARRARARRGGSERCRPWHHSVRRPRGATANPRRTSCRSGGSRVRGCGRRAGCCQSSSDKIPANWAKRFCLTVAAGLLDSSPMVASKTQAQAPARSLDQRMEALKRANDIRVRRAQLKKDLKDGTVQIEGILLDPPEYVSTAKVFDMLMAVPKFGRVKAARLLNQCRISQSKTVGGLSERQRAELVSLFNR